MAFGALKLADRLAVPIETEPFEPVENRVHRALRRPFAVGVFDAQQERAAEALGVEPVENAVRAPPICRKPVGEGAKRVMTADICG